MPVTSSQVSPIPSAVIDASGAVASSWKPASVSRSAWVSGAAGPAPALSSPSRIANAQIAKAPRPPATSATTERKSHLPRGLAVLHGGRLAGPPARADYDRRAVRRLLALGLLAALPLAAGCGGGVSKEEYVASVSGQPGAGRCCARVARGRIGGGATETAADVQLRLVAAATALAALEPPGALEEAHGALVEGVRALADEIGGVAALAASGVELPQALEQLSSLPSLAKLAEARELFAREDVELEPAPAPG